ncbi:glycine N-acyltransferase-like protein 3 [Haliotis rubra]|uniref:glycine N-acyltransferase-like protein 3 n=1 Tax=Haliotis rubra TaxID=36100 RepID=UPI001EE515B7|nr:glycine N-acyltransferase-like protein 3 [Haliotis rubra]
MLCVRNSLCSPDNIHAEGNAEYITWQSLQAMAIFLRNQQLPRLLSTLQNTRKANRIRGEIISKLRSVITDYDFIVDRWPDYRALVARVNPVTAKYPKHLDMASSVYATDSGALETILQTTHVIDWASKVGFAGVYTYEMPAVVNAMQKHNRQHYMDLHFDMKVTEKTLKPWSVPYGFKIRSLVPEQAPLVNSMWPHNDGIHSEPYIKELISKQPSCCLYNRESSLVGYALVYHYGYLGCLHVLKEHRRKGYGELITSHLAALCLQQMEEVHANVLEDNIASIALCKNVGFVQDQDSCWWIGTHGSE